MAPQGHPGSDDLPPDEVAHAVREGLRSAYHELLRGYVDWGGWRYYGWTHHGDHRNYYGPAIWSEADCVYRFTLALEEKFPGQVHCQLGVNKALTAGFIPEAGKQAIDIVVSDFSSFEEGEDSQDRFRLKRHEAFVEAKWLKKGRWTKLPEHESRARGIKKDLLNLQRAVEQGRCLVAAMLVFDDECALDYHPDLVEWPDGVERLLMSPSEVTRRSMGNDEVQQALVEIERLHDENCGSKRTHLPRLPL